MAATADSRTKVHSLVNTIQVKVARSSHLETIQDTESRSNVFLDTNNHPHVVDLTPKKMHSSQNYSGEDIKHTCCQWSPDGQRFAVGNSTGAISIFKRNQFVPEFTFRTGTKNKALADRVDCTACKWVSFNSVSSEQANDNASEALLAAYSDGTAILWGLGSSTSNDFGGLVFKVEEEGNEINAMDFCKSGEEFCTAGKDRCIRVYDVRTEKLKNSWTRGGTGQDHEKGMALHSNRLFSLNYKDGRPHVIISGSWDDNVFAWDVRDNKVCRSIHGPHIAGQSVDIRNNVLLTGSWRPEYAAELWDFGTGKRIERLQLKAVVGKSLQSLLVYQAMYAPASGIGKSRVQMDGVGIACGSGANCVVMFDMKTGAISNEVGLNWSAYGGIDDDEEEKSDAEVKIKEVIAAGGVYCVHADPLGECILFGGSEGRIGTASIGVRKKSSDRKRKRSSFATAEMLEDF